MEPVTHVLTGACLARTGLNRRAAYATVAMAIGAEFPDIDTLWALRGPVIGFQHHRGITHTFLGVPFEAALIVLVVYGMHRVRTSRRAGRSVAGSASTGDETLVRPLTAAPVRWGLLYLFALLALLSHLLLDYTNNYGLRPFFPFNPHWYAASITFIFDPAMFLLLLAAVVLPPLFRLIGSEVGARRSPFVARGWAVAALLGVAALWTLREVQHNRALNIVSAQILAAPQPESGDSNPTAPLDSPPVPAPLENAQAGLASAPELAPTPPPPVYLQPQRVLASPDPLNPFRWWTVADFGPVYQLAQVDTRSGSYIAAQQTHPKPPALPSFKAAEATALGRAYMDWSPMPFITIEHPAPGAESDSNVPPGHTLVTFRDPRFLGDVPGMRSHIPLQGTVELDAGNHVVRQTMDGKEQR